MKKYNKEEVLRQFEESGAIMYTASLKGDYRTNNKEGKKLVRIYQYFEKNRDFAMECILELVKSGNVIVRSKAASYCLALKENVALGEKVLREISKDEKNGIYAFNAKMTLHVWKHQGYLLVYQKKGKATPNKDTANLPYPK